MEAKAKNITTGFLYNHKQHFLEDSNSNAGKNLLNFYTPNNNNSNNINNYTNIFPSKFEYTANTNNTNTNNNISNNTNNTFNSTIANTTSNNNNNNLINKENNTLANATLTNNTNNTNTSNNLIKINYSNAPVNLKLGKNISTANPIVPNILNNNTSHSNNNNVHNNLSNLNLNIINNTYQKQRNYVIAPSDAIQKDTHPQVYSMLKNQFENPEDYLNEDLDNFLIIGKKSKKQKFSTVTNNNNSNNYNNKSIRNFRKASSKKTLVISKVTKSPGHFDQISGSNNKSSISNLLGRKNLANGAGITGYGGVGTSRKDSNNSIREIANDLNFNTSSNKKTTTKFNSSTNTFLETPKHNYSNYNMERQHTNTSMNNTTNKLNNNRRERTSSVYNNPFASTKNVNANKINFFIIDDKAINEYFKELHDKNIVNTKIPFKLESYLEDSEINTDIFIRNKDTIERIFQIQENNLNKIEKNEEEFNKTCSFIANKCKKKNGNLLMNVSCTNFRMNKEMKEKRDEVVSDIKMARLQDWIVSLRSASENHIGKLVRFNKTAGEEFKFGRTNLHYKNSSYKGKYLRTVSPKNIEEEVNSLTNRNTVNPNTNQASHTQNASPLNRKKTGAVQNTNSNNNVNNNNTNTNVTAKANKKIVNKQFNIDSADIVDNKNKFAKNTIVNIGTDNFPVWANIKEGLNSRRKEKIVKPSLTVPSEPGSNMTTQTNYFPINSGLNTATHLKQNLNVGKVNFTGIHNANNNNAFNSSSGFDSIHVNSYNNTGNQVSGFMSGFNTMNKFNNTTTSNFNATIKTDLPNIQNNSTLANLTYKTTNVKNNLPNINNNNINDINNINNTTSQYQRNLNIIKSNFLEELGTNDTNDNNNNTKQEIKKKRERILSKADEELKTMPNLTNITIENITIASNFVKDLKWNKNTNLYSKLITEEVNTKNTMKGLGLVGQDLIAFERDCALKIPGKKLLYKPPEKGMFEEEVILSSFDRMISKKYY